MPDHQRDSPSVLFVCVKNGGKSQMAAGLMRQLAGDAVIVESAGTRPGDSVNELSAASLGEVGIDISDQVPKPVTADLVRAADIVVTLGRDAHVEPVAGTDVENWDTDEPSERGIDGIERMRLVRDDIADRVAELAARLGVTPAEVKNLDQWSMPVVVIGAGQAGLSAGFYLRRAGRAADEDYVILDANTAPGGAWQHGWDSLRLFSPSEYSSLSGRPMPAWREGFPPAQHVQRYFTDYERRYDLPVHRPVSVSAVRRAKDGPRRYRLDTNAGAIHADAVISATGTWTRPFWPAYPGQRDFHGQQLHTVDYRSPTPFTGQHVVVVGGGNSAAQLLAEISTVATTTWVTPRSPRFLPDHVDGRVLFNVATARAAALASGEQDSGGVGGLGDIVMVPPVREARERGVLRAKSPFERLTHDAVVWSDGRKERADSVVWCTGFRPALAHLAPLNLIRENGHPVTHSGTEAVDAPGIHLLGYGDWTGPASATLIGVGRTARDTVGKVKATD